MPGSYESHEVPGEDRPMLLSQSAQAKLGFFKDVRAGTIRMRDYGMQNLEVARQARTGLFMIRIDHLSRRAYRKMSDLKSARPRGREACATGSAGGA